MSTEKVEDLRVFLLVCGLRRVKDPLYLLEAFSGMSLVFFKKRNTVQLESPIHHEK